MVSEEKIWEYLDGSLSGSDRQELEYAIANDTATAALYKEIASIHAILSVQTAEQPSMAFAENVMRAVKPNFLPRAAPQVAILPLVMYALPFVIVLALACAALWSGGADIPSIYHVSSHAINIMKLLFIVADSILMILLIEHWLQWRKNHQIFR